MIKLTCAQNGKKFEVPKNQIFAIRSTKSGDSMIYLNQDIPTPRDVSTYRGIVRVKEGVKEIDVDLDKIEEIDTGAYWFVDFDAILAQFPTKQGYRAIMPNKIGQTGPFNETKLHYKEVS